MNADSKEAAFQRDIIDQMVDRKGERRWKKGDLRWPWFSGPPASL